MKSSYQKENPLVNLLANVVLPVFILNKFSSRAPLAALLAAIALPLGYGLWSYSVSKKLNFISVLGFLNTLLTGGFAFFHLEGIWFAVKEAAFPLLIGCFVLASSFTASPFLRMMLFETGALNTEEIDAKVKEKGDGSGLIKLLQKATLFFSFTFFFSALLNFLLAYRIFSQIPLELPETERATLLNQQIADMTWQGYVVIFVPSICLFFVILFFFFRSLTRLTGIPFEKLMKS